MDFFNEVARPAINWWAIVAAGIAGFVVGGLWYSPMLFAKAWMKEMGFSEADLQKGNVAQIMGTAAVFTVLIAYCMARLMVRGGGWEGGMKLGLFVGVAVALGVAVNSLFERRSFTLIGINGAYWVVTGMVMGTILGAWR